MSLMQEADAQYAHEKGRDSRQSAWILSDRDVWYRNPFYQGPAVPHPEDYEDYDAQADFGPEPEYNDRGQVLLAGDKPALAPAPYDDLDDDIPF